MNKYSLEKLDAKMTFNDSLINTLCCKLSISSMVKRVDDYEFTIEILNDKGIDSSLLKNVLKKIMSFCSQCFWDDHHFKINEINTNNINLDRSMQLFIDVVIIESNQKEICFEVFINNGLVNLCSKLLISKNTNKIPSKSGC